MLHWNLFPNAEQSDWDDTLLQSQDYNVFQSFGWGEYKRAVGWTPMRWIARNDAGDIVAMAQVLIKSLGDNNIGWVPGGPILRFATGYCDDQLLISRLLTKLEPATGKVCIRFDSYLPHDASERSVFVNACARPIFKLRSGCSRRIDMHQSFADLAKQIKSRHRAYAKKALAEGILCRVGNDQQFVHDFIKLNREMAARKSLPALKRTTRDIETLCNALGEHATIFTGYVSNQPVSSYLVLTFGTKAFYLSAATGFRGRELRASYGVFYELLKYLQTAKFTEFDLGGIDLKSASAQGVNQFKKGFGGQPIEYLGEWEWSNSKWLRWAMNLAAWYKIRDL